MDNLDLHTRLSRVEGGWTTFQWASGIVTALVFGAMALLISVQLSTQSQVNDLSAQVADLPDKINRNLMELNRTLSSAITAAKTNAQPTVIYLPVFPQQSHEPPPSGQAPQR